MEPEAVISLAPEPATYWDYDPDVKDVDGSSHFISLSFSLSPPDSNAGSAVRSSFSSSGGSSPGSGGNTTDSDTNSGSGSSSSPSTYWESSSTRPPKYYKYREASRLHARRLRGSETKLLQDLAKAVAPGSNEGKSLDKMSTLRLAVGQLKLKRVLQALALENDVEDELQEEAREREPLSTTAVARIEDALGGGFMLVLSLQGDIVYTSTSVTHSLGYTPLEAMSRSIYELCHPADLGDVQQLLQPRPRGDGATGHASTSTRVCALIRLRYSSHASKSITLLRADRYKVFSISGKLRRDTGAAGGYFVGVADPLPHPADNRFPMWWWLTEHTFSCVQTLDMRFVSADASFERVLGYPPAEYLGHTCFEFLHPEDAGEDTCKSKTLLAKGQVQTMRIRLLVKGGGYVYVFAHKTTLNSNAAISSKNRMIVVTRNYVLGSDRGGGILAPIQLGSTNGDDEIQTPALEMEPLPSPPRLPLTPPPTPGDEEEEVCIPEDLCFDDYDPGDVQEE